MRNPRANPVKVLGVSPAAYAAARTAVLAFLDANDAQENVDEAAARATHPLLVADRVWNQLKAELGL